MTPADSEDVAALGRALEGWATDVMGALSAQQALDARREKRIAALETTVMKLTSESHWHTNALIVILLTFLIGLAAFIVVILR